MASLAFTDGFVSFGAVDISDYVTSITLDYAAEMLDETAMGDTTRIMKGGLKTWSATLEMNQDFADGLIDEILFPLVGTTGVLIVRPTSSAVGAANPNYTGTGIIASYNPFGNGVGDLAKTSVTIQSAGALSRATA